MSSANGIWTTIDCPVHAIRNYLGGDFPQYHDFYVHLRKNNKISDFLQVLWTIMCRENLPGVPILAMGYHYAYMMNWGVPIYHVFVIKGKHIYNLSRTHILDSVYGRIEPISINKILGELRDALRVIYIIGWDIDALYERSVREYSASNDILVGNLSENIRQIQRTYSC